MWLLKGNEVVEDRRDSHVEAAASHYLKAALASIDACGRDFIAEEVVFDHPIGVTTCVETTDLDEITYAQRVGRNGLTRFVKNRQPQGCNVLTVILKRSRNSDHYVIITGYVGYKAEPEIWDRTATATSRSYWETHALVWGTSEIIPGSEVSVTVGNNVFRQDFATLPSEPDPEGWMDGSVVRDLRRLLFIWAGCQPNGGIEFENPQGETYLFLARSFLSKRGAWCFALGRNSDGTRARVPISQDTFLKNVRFCSAVRVFDLPAAEPRSGETYENLVQLLEGSPGTQLPEVDMMQFLFRGGASILEDGRYDALAERAEVVARERFPQLDMAQHKLFANVAVEVAYSWTGRWGSDMKRQEWAVKRYSYLQGQSPDIVVSNILAEEERWGGLIFASS